MIVIRRDAMFGAVQVEDTRDRIVKVPKGWAGGKSKYCRTNGTFHVQGEGECVAVSVAHMLEHYGIKLQPEGLYWIGQRVDEVMVPHVGTTVRGVVKALHKLGIVSRYGWAKDIDTIRYWLQVHGPVLMAGPWMEGMDDTDSLGYVRLHGLYLDRHCWIVDGWGKRGFRCKNTAGRE